MRILLAFLVALAVTLLLTPYVKKLGMKLGVYDQPDARKVHKGIITRMGGIGIYAGFLAGLLVYGNFSQPVIGLLISSTMIVAVGFYDDVKGISPKMKLLGQVAAASVLVGFGVRLEFLTNPFSGNLIDLGFWGLPITLFWLIGVSNAVNLIDGLDGLAGGISAIAALSLAVVSLAKGFYGSGAIALVLVASLIGFLRYNFHPAQLFMGDCGALFLGFVLGALSILGLSEGTTVIALFIPVMVLGIPILDTFFAILRRYKNKKPIFEADKGHLHHRLLAMGVNHKYTVLFIYAVTFLLCGLAVLVTMLTTVFSILLLLFTIALIFVGAARLGIMGNGEPSSS